MTENEKQAESQTRRQKIAERYKGVDPSVLEVIPAEMDEFMKSNTGAVIKQEAYAIDSNGDFSVFFLNADTDHLAPGQYSYDVRYVINPYYDDSGAIVDGDQVITPHLPRAVVLLATVGQI